MIKPRNDYVLFLPEVRTKVGSIHVPLFMADPKASQIGKVVAIGEKVRKIKQDDIIFFQRFLPQEKKIENQIYMLLKESEVLGVLR